MTDTQKTARIETLELNRETLQDLTEQEGEQSRGGLNPQTCTCGDCGHCTIPDSGCFFR